MTTPARTKEIQLPHQLGHALRFCWLAILSFLLASTASGATVEVRVQEAIPHFSPLWADIHVGDTVKWIWIDSLSHSVVSGDGNTGTPDGLFSSGIHVAPFTFSVTFQDVGAFPYYCGVHRKFNTSNVWPVVKVTAATPTPTPRPPSQSQLLNISTRMEVLAGDQVIIGGFIINGTAPKKVILRAIGPSLAPFGISDPLADPILELHGSDSSLITMNDNWKDTDEANISATGLAPTNDLESAIVATLDPGSYTAIVKGKNDGTGGGLVEGYDLNQAANSQLGNISTRGFVETGANVMIGGFILGGQTGNANVVVRALGPSLTAFGVAGALADPTLELRDGNGTLVRSNDNWKESQQTEIQGTGLQPSNDLESAIFETLAAGSYTAIVAGKGGLTGVGLVEVYRLP